MRALWAATVVVLCSGPGPIVRLRRFLRCARGQDRVRPHWRRPKPRGETVGTVERGGNQLWTGTRRSTSIHRSADLRSDGDSRHDGSGDDDDASSTRADWRTAHTSRTRDPRSCSRTAGRASATKSRDEGFGLDLPATSPWRCGTTNANWRRNSPSATAPCSCPWGRCTDAESRTSDDAADWNGTRGVVPLPAADSSVARHDCVKTVRNCCRLSAAALWPFTLPVIASLVRQWTSDENYSHGLLVVPFALLFAWRSRRGLAIAPPRPHPLGLVVVAASMAVFLAGPVRGRAVPDARLAHRRDRGQHPVSLGPRISAGWRFRWSCSCSRYRCLRCFSTRLPFPCNCSPRARAKPSSPRPASRCCARATS